MPWSKQVKTLETLLFTCTCATPAPPLLHAVRCWWCKQEGCRNCTHVWEQHTYCPSCWAVGDVYRRRIEIAREECQADCNAIMDDWKAATLMPDSTIPLQ